MCPKFLKITLPETADDVLEGAGGCSCLGSVNSYRNHKLTIVCQAYNELNYIGNIR